MSGKRDTKVGPVLEEEKKIAMPMACMLSRGILFSTSVVSLSSLCFILF